MLEEVLKRLPDLDQAGTDAAPLFQLRGGNQTHAGQVHPARAAA